MSFLQVWLEPTLVSDPREKESVLLAIGLRRPGIVHLFVFRDNLVGHKALKHPSEIETS